MNYTPPKSWNEINLLTFQQLLPHIQTNTQFSRIQFQNYWIRISKILGVPDEHIDDMTRDEFELWCSNLQWIHTLPQTLNFNVVIDDVRYTFNDNPTTWHVNEFVDFSAFTNDRTQDEVLQELHNVVAIFLRPVKRTWNWKKFFKGLIFLNFNGYEMVQTKYVSSEQDERAKLFQERLPADVAYSICLFFCLLVNEFTNNTLLSSIQNLLEEVQADSKASSI
jgi:hypothetical protein